MGDIIEPLLASHGLYGHRCVFPRPHAQEAYGDEVVDFRGIELVPRNLFQDELVIRLILIEAANYIVAIAPGVRTFIVIGETVRIAVAGDVEPMAAPFFTVVREARSRSTRLA